MRPECDVLIVGGGPAGLVTAIAARLEDLSVNVLDRRPPPLDKPCGEGLMPDAVALLGALGVDLEGVGQPFAGIRYLDGELVAEGRFGEPGLGVRRPVLHRALAERATELGVGLEWGTTVEGLDPQGVVTTDGVRAARWVVGADGLRSRVRQWAGLERSPPSRPRRFGVRRHYRCRPWTDLVEVHWVDGCEAYVTPVSDEEVGVAILWSGEKAGYEELLARFPRLTESLRDAEPTGRAQGVGPLWQRSRAVWRDRVALVGDAAGYVDAITGEGLAVAFHQAVALAEALRVDHLPSYARRHLEIRLLPELLTRLLLAAEARPRLRRRLVATLARDPELFSRLLEVHARQRPLSALGVTTVPRLLVGLLRTGH